ncbi:MAG: DUF2293 domain-containing protein [Euryarchaeota archaeon]|nr:DUF2293 domain-containing protein [Euryarchaeota archaeon]MDE1837700.1 DUF2293 domain-containing protein [Euryarchaeota archaeon]MDE1881741.1 DUF2293 domain-containing protein [Euryarchaeota archaeon]MDE2045970.1 DUF2293 domain-containing protein [Thermoplasmata archaeon]
MARAPAPRLVQGLPVWHSREREGYWNPEYGEVELPEGWVFLPSGDAFVTRQAKKGPHWVLLKRRKGYTATLGVFCPEESVQQAEAKAAETEGSRAARREVGKRTRARAEERYRAELEQEILAFLEFAPEHALLAREIAKGAAARATPVGSGRVGRTRTLPLSKRAEFAARAYIRHKHTNYEADLWRASGENPTVDLDPRDPLYREIKGEAQRAVDRFLAEHRG